MRYMREPGLVEAASSCPEAVDARTRLWLRLRQCLAACAVGALAVACWSLALVWHEVDFIDPTRMAAAFYVGPDYHVIAAERAAMLRVPFLTPCTGLDHLHAGVQPILLLGACAALVAFALFARPRQHKLVAALASAALAPAALLMTMYWGLLAHLLQKVGPSRWPDGLVYSALVVYVALSWAMTIVLIVEYRRAKSSKASVK
jgi:hypothetical protein